MAQTVTQGDMVRGFAQQGSMHRTVHDSDWSDALRSKESNHMAKLTLFTYYLGMRYYKVTVHRYVEEWVNNFINRCAVVYKNSDALCRRC